jgi:cold shock CspA family protein
MLGVIHRFTSRGFGFIRQPDNPDAEDLFVHISEIQGRPSFQTLEGSAVEFETGKFKGQPVARNVRIVAPAASEQIGGNRERH